MTTAPVRFYSGCTCGHDHTTERGEHITLCLDCSCGEFIDRCVICGDEANCTAIVHGVIGTFGRSWVCSRGCALQLGYWVSSSSLLPAGAEKPIAEKTGPRPVAPLPAGRGPTLNVEGTR